MKVTLIDVDAIKFSFSQIANLEMGLLCASIKVEMCLSFSCKNILYTDIKNSYFSLL